MKKNTPDILIVFATALLLIIGIIMVFSASYYDTIDHDPYYYFKKQLIWGAIGTVAMILAMKIDYFKLKPLTDVAFYASLILLGLVLVPGIGFEIKGAQRWIDLGFTNLQPSELVKISLVFYLAKYLSERTRKLKRFFIDLGPYLLLIGIVSVMIMLEPDLGTTVVVVLSALSVIFAAGIRIWHMIFLGICTTVAGAASIVREPYRLNRIIGYLDPWAHASKEGYQTVNSLYALGSGGLLGVGLGNSRQKLAYLPEQHTDFIYAILGEELGFFGAFLIIILFFIIAWRGYRTAVKCPEVFGSLLAVGITTMVVFQAFINMGVVTGLLPVTGISLPFISYGGSSLLLSMFGIGVLLNISSHCPKT